MSRLAKLSLANRSLVGLATIAVIVFGLIATASLKQELLPSLQLPMAVVSAPYPGASPEIVERAVTQPVEAAIQGVEGLEATTGTSSNGFSLVQAEFEYGTDLDEATAAMREAIGRLGGQFPQGVEPEVLAGSFDDIPVLLLAASVDGTEAEAVERLRTTVVPELEAVPGVRSVEITGARDERIVIRLDRRALAARGVSAASVQAALQANGVTIPGGTLTADGQTRSLDVGGQFTSVEDLAAVPLMPSAPPAGTATGQPGAAGGAGAGSGAGAAGQGAGAGTGAGAAGQGAGAGQAPSGRARARAPEPVTLGDVAEVALEPEAATSVTRTDGRPSLGITVTKTVDGNTVAVSSGIKDQIPDLEAALGGGAALTVVFDQAPFIEESIEGLTTEGLLGLAFAVLVILIFLLSLRSTIVTAVSIPLSLLMAMIGLYVGGYSLNILTLGALTVAVGRVVDDSIVVLENIKRHLGYGEEKRHAIITAVKEVAGAVTASTATTVAVFLPIAFVGGQTGELFRPFAMTITIALVASLLVSLTIIPVLASWFLGSKQLDAAELERAREAALAKERRSPLQRVYVPLIEWTTKHRVVTLLLGILVLIGTGALVPRLETNFVDNSGQNTVTVTQELPAGTAIEGTDAAAQRVEAVIAGLDGVESYQVTVGGGGLGGGLFGGGGSTNEASFSITTDPEIDQEAFTGRLRERLEALTDVGDLRIAPLGAEFGGSSLEVVVQAQDPAVLRDAAGMVEQAVAGIDGATDVVNNLAADEAGLQVTPDRERAAAAGLSDAQIGQAVRQAFEGAQAGPILVGGEQRTVVIREGDAPASLAQVRRLALPTPTGAVVRLDDVAEVEEVTRPVQLTRTDGERSATVTAAPSAADVGAVTATLRQRLAELTLPEGVTYEIGGVSAEQDEAFSQLGIALLAAIVIVFMVMVAAFGSLLQPLILLVSVPFAATGAIGLLLLTRTALGAPALIGLLMLVGIVVTNAIVLIDLINQYRAQERPVREAVVEGARQRLRPVLMTAVATICALLPMALGFTGGGVFISRPLAIVVIGGLVSSTLLTLILVPTLYTMVEERRERRRQRRAAPPAPPKKPDEASEEEKAVPVG